MATEKRSVQQIQREYSIAGVLRKDNTSGVCGVSQIHKHGHKYYGMYVARIRCKGYKPLVLGVFKTLKEAEDVLKIARQKKAKSDGALLDWYDYELNAPHKGEEVFNRY